MVPSDDIARRIFYLIAFHRIMMASDAFRANTAEFNASDKKQILLF